MPIQKLFIDPLLIPASRHPEICTGARGTYVDQFGMVIRLLKATSAQNDVAWRNARRLMTFPEIKWTCLGYGAHSVSAGEFTTDGVMQTAKEIVEMGTEDPDLFVALGVFEEGIRPDRISDMTVNVILPDLLAFNEKVLKALGVPTKTVTLTL